MHDVFSHDLIEKIVWLWFELAFSRYSEKILLIICGWNNEYIETTGERLVKENYNKYIQVVLRNIPPSEPYLNSLC